MIRLAPVDSVRTAHRFTPPSASSAAFAALRLPSSQSIAILTAVLILPLSPIFAGEDTPVALYGFTPPVLKPSGAEFKFWRAETVFTKTYYVDCNAPKSSDQNPGSADAPFKTISRAAQLLQPGENVIVRAGTYRECIRPARGGTSPTQMIGYHAEGEVLVKGSELTANKWTAEDAATGLYALDLSTLDFGNYNPFALENLPNASFDIMDWAEPLRGKLPYTLPRGMVFQNGERLKRVASREELQKSEGSHWTDRPANKLFIHTRGKKDPNGLAIEITSRPSCFRPSARGLGFIHVKGFTFEQVGNGFPRPQEGALSVCAGHHWLIENNTVRQVNGIGIDIGDGWYGGDVKPPESGALWKLSLLMTYSGWNIVRRNHVSETGVCGIAGLPAMNALIEENTLINNTLYPIGNIYECGGIKMHTNQGSLLRRNFISDQSLNGIWMDWDNRDARCTQNVLLNCETGIFIEASVVEPYCSIDRNIVWGGRQGIIEQDSKNQLFVHNFIARTDVGLHLRGKLSQRVVAGIVPTTGGGHTAANNLFFECKEDIKAATSPKFAANSLADNASQKDGLQAELDLPAGQLKLTALKPLTAFCKKTLITDDLHDRPWPTEIRNPGPVPLSETQSVTIPLRPSAHAK